MSVISRFPLSTEQAESSKPVEPFETLLGKTHKQIKKVESLNEFSSSAQVEIATFRQMSKTKNEFLERLKLMDRATSLKEKLKDQIEILENQKKEILNLFIRGNWPESKPYIWPANEADHGNFYLAVWHERGVLKYETSR